MKVGTDSVLLGAWTPAVAPTRILDIGADDGTALSPGLYLCGGV